jgi:hypothetical protein
VKVSRSFCSGLLVIERSSAAGGGTSPFTSASPFRIIRVITVGSWKPSLKTTRSAEAGRQLVPGFQFGLRTSTTCRPGA